MPLYDFACKACSHVQEELIRAKDEQIVFCAKCGYTMEKQLSVPAVIKPYGDEGQAKKAIDAIVKKDKQTKIYSR